MLKKVDLHLKVSERTAKALEVASQHTGASKSWIMRHVLNQWLLKKGFIKND